MYEDDEAARLTVAVRPQFSHLSIEELGDRDYPWLVEAEEDDPYTLQVRRHMKMAARVEMRVRCGEISKAEADRSWAVWLTMDRERC